MPRLYYSMIFDNKDVLSYLKEYLDLKSLNNLLKTSKKFAKYRGIIRKVEVDNEDHWYNTNNELVKKIAYYARPVVKEICLYKAGERDGEYKSWYRNGQLCVHCFYKNGERDDKYKSWHDNGQLCVHFYKDGGIGW